MWRIESWTIVSHNYNCFFLAFNFDRFIRWFIYVEIHWHLLKVTRLSLEHLWLQVALANLPFITCCCCFRFVDPFAGESLQRNDFVISIFLLLFCCRKTCCKSSLFCFFFFYCKIPIIALILSESFAFHCICMSFYKYGVIRAKQAAFYFSWKDRYGFISMITYLFFMLRIFNDNFINVNWLSRDHIRRPFIITLHVKVQ